MMLVSTSAGSSSSLAVTPSTTLSVTAKWAVAVAIVVLLTLGTVIGLNLGGLRSRLVRSRVASSPVNGPAAGIPVRPVQIRPAVAVLGFKNLSGRPDEAWLSTALSEMLTTEVGAGEKLRTIPGENIALMKMNQVTAVVAEDLYLDVFGAVDVFFEEKRAVAEGKDLRTVVLESGLMTEDEVDRALDVKAMTRGGIIK